MPRIETDTWNRNIGVKREWKEIDRIRGRFSKKELKVPRCTASRVAELELNSNSRRGKILCMVVKDWQMESTDGKRLMNKNLFCMEVR
jgi:hypothetical protein